MSLVNINDEDDDFSEEVFEYCCSEFMWKISHLVGRGLLPVS